MNGDYNYKLCSEGTTNIRHLFVAYKLCVNFIFQHEIRVVVHKYMLGAEMLTTWASLATEMFLLEQSLYGRRKKFIIDARTNVELEIYQIARL